MKRKNVALLLTAAIAALALPAAGATPLDAVLTVDNGSANPGDVARVRVLHASPDAPAVDVWVDGSPAFTGLAFEEITDYAALPPGTYTVQVEPAGAGGAGPFVIDADLTLAAGADYTVIATGRLAELAPAVLIDDNSTPAAGEARLRFFHGSPDAPPVDIALIGGPVLVAGAAFGQDATLSVPAGTYDLEVRVAGTTTEVLQLRGVTLPEGVVASAFATGLVAQGSADRTLYLGAGERFRVDVSFADFEGNPGVGKIAGTTGTSGTFWFLDPTNLELLVKVLDGTALNDAFWVFYGAASNVPFTIAVTDTATGQSREYVNPSGTFASRGDTHAFLAE